jgi:hypothetical protein
MLFRHCGSCAETFGETAQGSQNPEGRARRATAKVDIAPDYRKLEDRRIEVEDTSVVRELIGVVPMGGHA